MTKRLYEVARDMGLSSSELSERISTLTLSFSVSNHLSILTEEQIDELKRALERSGGPASREEKVVKTGVIRRRTRRRVKVGADSTSAETVEVDDAPVESEPVVAAEETAAEAPDEPESSRRRFATVVTRDEPVVEETPVEEPAPAPVEEPAVEEPPAEVEEVAAVAEEPPAEEVAEVSEEAPKRRRFATVVTREAPAAVAPEELAASPELEDDPSRRRFATVHTRQDIDVDVSQPSPMELAALARKEADRAAAQTRGKGGARVVGTMNAEQLRVRLEADKKDFSPGARTRRDDSRNKKNKRSKRVVQSRDLYDKFRRGRKRSQSRQSGGQSTKITQAAEHKRVVKMEESILVSDLAHQMGVKAGEIAMKLMFDLGLKGANINTAVDHDTAMLIAELYEFRVEQVGFDITEYLPNVEDDGEHEITRPPVVTVMGHVDHGKTSLLDAIRKSSVTTTEHGGITQHIGAYMVETENGSIVTFLDTPGHEAFTALRARGAKATDVVILVVAADDGVMPQTVEAINHAKDAGVPIIVAVNKIDLPGANPERVKQALTEYELVPEDWGGTTIFVEVSAKQRTNVDTLLEMIDLQAEVMELQANPERKAEGLVIESKLDVGRGPVATVLVQQGTLRPGEILVMGQFYGRVRTMTNEFGDVLDEAPPSTPVEITGLNGVPGSGEKFYVVADEKDARTVADHVAAQAKQAELAQSASGATGMDRLAEMLANDGVKELKVIVKGDVQGSVEAINEALRKLSTDKVAVRIIHSAVGSITETDVNLAASSSEETAVVIVGFNVRPEQRAQSLAEQTGVSIVLHSVIYDIIDQVRALMTGLLEPIYKEEYLGRAEVRKTFGIPKVGTVAGCMVTDGSVHRNSHVRVVRDSVVVYESTIGSLKHFEQDQKEVKSGFECGISVDWFNDIKVGDILESYKLVETEATL